MGSEVQLFEYYLKPGYIFVYRQPSVIYTVLGSCVAVTLYDQELKFGGMNHFLFPYATDPNKGTAKHGSVAVRYLVKLVQEEGGDKRNLTAQLFGGAHRSQDSGPNLGAENVKVAREILEKQGIPISSLDVGGSMGRKIIYSTATNEAVVYKVEHIRAGDWYPYEDRR